MQADDTQPRRADVFPPDESALPPDESQFIPGDDDSSGPGCLAWGVVGVFSLGLALVVVLLATFAGWNDGLRTAHSHATETRTADRETQCRLLPTDIAAGRFGLAERRFDDLAQDGDGLPPCAQSYVLAATEAYNASLATATPAITATVPPTATFTPTVVEPAAASPDPTQPAEPQTAPTATDAFDLAGLLDEATLLMNEGDYRGAIRTLDAIQKIDESFRTQEVDTMLFNALTNRANRIRLAGGNLGELVQLVNRAENYGDVAELGFERDVAQIYLDAQSFIDIDYRRAIVLLQQVKNFSPNYRDVNALLVDQYEKYGDAFGFGGEYCRALEQYNAALQIQTPPGLVSKRDTAQQQCTAAQTPAVGGTPAPGTTPATTAPGDGGSNPPGATSTPTIAPIGQPGT
jgi:tetratricopeptide (TPR) repeat protein